LEWGKRRTPKEPYDADEANHTPGFPGYFILRLGGWDFLETSRIISLIFQEGPLRLTFSEPKSADEGAIRAVLRPVSTSKGKFQLEKQIGTQVFHENWPENEALSRALLLFESFRRLNATTAEAEHALRKTKKGKLLYQKKQKPAVSVQQEPHNRQKNYILKEGEDIRPLKDLGIFTAEGKVAAPMFDKYRQINRFIELIDDVAAKDPRQSWHVVDFGCGKSYLTFFVYYYFTKILKKEAKIIGFDLKKDVIEKCNRLALEYGYEGLSFRYGDIANYRPETKPDMILSLHACDTATDLALYHGVSVQADYIYSVPCCQHELNAMLKPANLSLLADYGIIKERFAALATDALRAGMLEYAGYKTQVLEFVDFVHSPKNLLLRASRRKSPLPPAQKEKVAEKIRLLLAEIGAEPSIVRLLGFEDLPTERKNSDVSGSEKTHGKQL
jgi:SAM-dependent methyltransferase